MPSSACQPIGLATQHAPTIAARGREPHTELIREPHAIETPDDRAVARSPVPLPGTVSVVVAANDKDDGPAENHTLGLRRKLASALAETTPTLLPELLRSFAQQAGRLAHHPFNALDNNPFIMREWLIVSLVLDAAANSLEKRFETLFLSSAS